jgi:hypothetical protein
LRIDGEDEMTDDRERRNTEIEARAAAAYEHLFDEDKRSRRNDWAQWMFIADGLMLGRNDAMKRANAQEPKGKGYAQTFSRWMATRHWARDLDPPTRNDLFWCAERRSEVEAWRDDLEPQERAKKNHPTHMKRAYLKAHQPPKVEEEEGEDKKRKEKSDDTALRDELFQMRGQLAQEREDHRKTKRDRDEAYRNPLTVWQANAQEAATKLVHDNRPRAEAVLRALATLLGFAVVPEKSAIAEAQAAVEAAGLQRQCAHCGKSFPLSHPGKKYCSEKCRNAAGNAAKRPASKRRRRLTQDEQRAVQEEATQQLKASMSDQSRAELVKDLRAQGMTADQIEEEIAKRAAEAAFAAAKGK